MRWLARYATRVAVRRVVALLVVAFLAWAGIGRARAESCGFPGFTEASIAAGSEVVYPVRDEALDACNAIAPVAVSVSNGYANLMQFKGCRLSGTDKLAAVYEYSGKRLRVTTCEESDSTESGEIKPVGWLHTSGCSVGTEWNEFTLDCVTPCSDRPTMWGWNTHGDGAACVNGCEYITALDPNHEPPFGIAPSGSQCQATDDNAPVDAQADSDGDGEPDVTDDFPDDPNETDDTDGDGVGDNADTQPEDPNNGQDGTGPNDDDGDPQTGPGNESDNVAAGGGTCAAPPTCSGDGIQCAQLYQMWKLNCKSAVVTGDPTVCQASYTCTGDSAQCAQVGLLRVAACKDPIGGDEPGDAPGDANGNGIPDELEGAVAEVPGEDPVLGESSGAGWGAVDTDGWLGGGSCPGLPPVTIGGHSYNLDELPCQQGELIGWAIYLFFITAAGFVIGRAASGT